MRPLLERLQIRYLLPVLPLVVFAIVPSGPIRDNSFLWHVRAGTIQLESLRVLVTDPFSYTADGESWRTQSWLAELLYGFVESLSHNVGWAPLLVMIVGVGALSLTGLTIYSGSRSVLATTGGLIVAAWLLAPFAVPRPVIFSYLLLAMLMLTLALGPRAWWAIVPIIWVWAGVHGSWVIAIGLVVLETARQRSTRLGVVAGVAVVMTGLTAHGIGTWKIVVSFAGNAAALKGIVEWQAPDFGSLLQMPYLMIAMGLLIAASTGLIRPAELWVVIPFFAFGLMANRSVPVAALVLVPFAARAVGWRLPQGDRRLTLIPVAILVVAVGLVTFVYLGEYADLDAERFPSDGAIQALDGRRFFHDMAVGGYLIYRDGPERRVYVDDRAELYGAERMLDFKHAVEGDYEDLFANLEMSAAIVRPWWPLHENLRRDGWSVAYEDAYFIVLLRPSQ